jgi:hypothetical protein
VNSSKMFLQVSTEAHHVSRFVTPAVILFILGAPVSRGSAPAVAQSSPMSSPSLTEPSTDRSSARSRASSEAVLVNEAMLNVPTTVTDSVSTQYERKRTPRKRTRLNFVAVPAIVAVLVGIVGAMRLRIASARGRLRIGQNTVQASRVSIGTPTPVRISGARAQVSMQWEKGKEDRVVASKR